MTLEGATENPGSRGQFQGIPECCRRRLLDAFQGSAESIGDRI
jgi:hypothetical protein